MYRTFAYSGVAIILVLATPVGISRIASGNETLVEQIFRLVNQLGDESFEIRESASTQLEAIGEPALPALRAAAAKSADAEIRLRAGQLVRTIEAFVHAAAAKKAWQRFEGTWRDAGGNQMAFKDDRWTSQAPAFGPVGGTVKIIEMRPGQMHIDLATEEGQSKGMLVKAIFRIEDDTLHYCGTYSETRPTEFKTVDQNVYYALKQVRK